MRRGTGDGGSSQRRGAATLGAAARGAGVGARQGDEGRRRWRGVIKASWGARFRLGVKVGRRWRHGLRGVWRGYGDVAGKAALGLLGQLALAQSARKTLFLIISPR